MNVGIFSPTYPNLTGDGGIGTYTRHLAQALTSLGHGVHVLTSGSPATTIRDGEVTVHLVKADSFPILERFVPGSGACWRIGAAMRRLVFGYQLDIVEFPNWEGFGVGYAMRRTTPLVVRLHTSSLESSLLDGNGRSRAITWDIRRETCVSKAADALVTHSLAHRRRMADELGIDEQRISVVPHGIPVDTGFRRAPRIKDELLVVYLGRLEKRKGTIDLLGAIPEILREIPNVRFVFIGTDRPHCPGGRTHAEYIERELPVDVREKIVIRGRLTDDEVDHWLQSGDLFVAPSLYESFGMIFLEAMRWGTPVVGTRVGGIPEIVKDGESGVLVSPANPTELAKTIVQLLRNEEQRVRIGEAGRRHVESNFSVERMARSVLSFYAATLVQSRFGPAGKHATSPV